MDFGDVSDKVWFALRVTYNREIKVKSELDGMGIESFIPMCYKDFVRDGRKQRKLVPSIHNLIFVKMTSDGMKKYKAETSLPIRYIMDKSSRKPIIVPEYQMRNFMAVAGTNDEGLIYFSPEELQAKKGDRVRITGGIFEGCEGTFMRLKGDRRVVVSIPGVVAVATAFVHPSLIEKIN